MSLFSIEQEEKIRRCILSHIKDKYHVRVQKHRIVFDQFAPDYYLKNRSGKETIIIFRNTPIFPDVYGNEIRLALDSGISVYIAIFNYEFDPILDEFLEKCDQYGVGIIQCTKTFHCKMLQPSISDYPKLDKIIENRIKIFISSKFWITEREDTRKILLKYKHQPICVERLSNQKPVERMCYDWIDKSQFFIGIITRQYRPIVEKEIKYVLKKKKERCLIYIKNECFQENSLKLKSLIKFIGKKVTYHKFDDEITLRRVIPNQIADLIGKYAR
jgi:hypothetical protein